MSSFLSNILGGIVTKQQLKLREDFAKLTSIDNIGIALALTIMLKTGGDISRFKTVGQYASYCRCVNGGRYSIGKKKAKTNTRNENKYLVWAFKEAAHFSIRFNDVVRRYYQRKQAKTSIVVVRKNVGHKLAGAFYWLKLHHEIFRRVKANKRIEPMAYRYVANRSRIYALSA